MAWWRVDLCAAAGQREQAQAIADSIRERAGKEVPVPVGLARPYPWLR